VSPACEYDVLVYPECPVQSLRYCRTPAFDAWRLMLIRPALALQSLCMVGGAVPRTAAAHDYITRLLGPATEEVGRGVSDP
jgi:hypothetical protein